MLVFLFVQSALVALHSPAARFTAIGATRTTQLRLGLFESSLLDAADGVRSTIDGIKADYQDDEFVPDGYAKAAHILFLAEEDAERKATALKRRIEAGELTFGDAALLFSACPTRDLNGSLGIFPSLSRLQEGTLRGDRLPYDGKDTTSFDRLVFEGSLNVIHQVNSHWGVHLVLIDRRGGPPSTSDLMAQASELVGQAMGGQSKSAQSGGFGGATQRKRTASRGAKRRRKG